MEFFEGFSLFFKPRFNPTADKAPTRPPPLHRRGKVMVLSLRRWSAKTHWKTGINVLYLSI